MATLVWISFSFALYEHMRLTLLNKLVEFVEYYF